MKTRDEAMSAKLHGHDESEDAFGDQRTAPVDSNESTADLITTLMAIVDLAKSALARARP